MTSWLGTEKSLTFLQCNLLFSVIHDMLLCSSRMLYLPDRNVNIIIVSLKNFNERKSATLLFQNYILYSKPYYSVFFLLSQRFLTDRHFLNTFLWFSVTIKVKRYIFLLLCVWIRIQV